VDEFENQFTFTGATKGADSVKVDLSAEDEDIENLESFAEKISEALA
ncbi:MAG: flavodoxin, partial [Streptococcus salivarius]